MLRDAYEGKEKIEIYMFKGDSINSMKGPGCDLCLWEREALLELADWLKKIRVLAKETEQNFIKNKIRGGEVYVPDMRMQSVREMR